MDSTQTIVFFCHLKNLQKVRDFVREELCKLSITETEKSQIVIAIDEVCTNLIVHSNHNDHSKKIKLTLKLLNTPKGLTIEFEESGTPFNYESYTEPAISDLKEKQSKGKLGLILVRRIMDKIEYLHEGNLNICRLYKSLA